MCVSCICMGRLRYIVCELYHVLQPLSLCLSKYPLQEQERAFLDRLTDFDRIAAEQKAKMVAEMKKQQEIAEAEESELVQALLDVFASYINVWRLYA